jgi:hypothetical protein
MVDHRLALSALALPSAPPKIVLTVSSSIFAPR